MARRANVRADANTNCWNRRIQSVPTIRLSCEFDNGLNNLLERKKKDGNQLIGNTFTTRGLVTCAVSPTTLRRPADQNHQATLSFKAQTRLAFFRPVFCLHSSSFAALLPRIDHQTPLRPGLISPFASLLLYSSASLRRRVKGRGYLVCNNGRSSLILQFPEIRGFKGSSVAQFE